MKVKEAMERLQNIQKRIGELDSILKKASQEQIDRNEPVKVNVVSVFDIVTFLEDYKYMIENREVKL